MSYNCEICDNNFTTKQRLNTHNETEKHKTVKRLYENLNNKYQNELNILNKKLDILKEELKEEKKEKQEVLILNIKLQDKINSLEEKSEEYRKIIEKVATKSTNTVKNYNHNNYLNYISSEPIIFSNLKNKLKDIVTTKSIMYNDDDFHDHIVDNILKDKNGKDKVLCTDINRKNFTYKDETSGELVSDPELERLREQLKKGADIKSVKRELLNKLIEQYENTEIDPYIKFYDILKKLEFGNPFIDHVAKKTYIKTKSNNAILE